MLISILLQLTSEHPASLPAHLGRANHTAILRRSGSEPILMVLSSLNFIGALLLAELHGRMGYFPPLVRTRPLADVLPRRYEVAEILDLQAPRDLAQRRR